MTLLWNIGLTIFWLWLSSLPDRRWIDLQRWADLKSEHPSAR